MALHYKNRWITRGQSRLGNEQIDVVKASLSNSWRQNTREKEEIDGYVSKSFDTKLLAPKSIEAKHLS